MISEAFAKFLSDIKDGVESFSVDLENLKEKKAKEQSLGKNQDQEDGTGASKKSSMGNRIISSTTPEPMTRLRKDVGELKQAEEDPVGQFLKDRLNDIFGS